MRLRSALLFSALLCLAGGVSDTAHAQLVRRAEPFVEPAPQVPPPVPGQPPVPAQPLIEKPAEPQLPVKRAVPVEEPTTPPAADKPKTTEETRLTVEQMQANKSDKPNADATTPTDEEKEKEKEQKKKEEKEKKAKLAKLMKPELPKPEPEPAIDGALLSIGREEVKTNLEASWKTLKDARTIKLEVAGPRGQIVDRNGVCLAQNRMAYYLALKFPVQQKTASDEQTIAYARERLALANTVLGKKWELIDKQITEHYKERRWLPLIISAENGVTIELTDEEVEKIKPKLGSGLVLHPTYARWYPKISTACHIIGYTGIVRKLPMGPIIDGEPFTEEPMGRAGLELSFENDLRGRPGALSILFGPDGSELHREWTRRPVPGHNVVTTLDYNMQRFAEDALQERAKNGGAMVIVDVRNGDILAMASGPGYNLNDCVPRMPGEFYNKLLADPRTPLVGRAFQGNYFPASTFKIITALSGLEAGVIDINTTYNCDSSYQIGDRVFHNWNKDSEGPMNVVGAIKRSCNTWFYQAAMQITAARITTMAERLGFGQPTGLPLAGEGKGFLPTDAYYQQRDGHKILPGMLASIAIGQVVTATPLQVAQGMACVADGVNMPKLRLVKQVQDYNDNVTQAWMPEVRKQVSLNPSARDTVVKGMMAVVQGEGGTGHNAQFSKDVLMAGKTGTAQWQIFPDESRNRWLAWFTGFLPANNPVYAFAVVYEGGPGERVSGGAIAAPIVSDVFDKIYKNATATDPLLLASQEAPRAELVDDTANAPKAEVVNDGAGAPPPPPPPPPPAQEQPAGIGGFFKRLFGRKN